ncbi:MAG: YybH family protein [Flavobacteriales bacterium]
MKATVYCLLIAVLFGCKESANQSFNKSESLESLKTAMAEQEESWNKGDVTGFMKWYWKSDSLTFIGSKGLTYGWNQTLANYQKSYPSPEAMGKLRFTNLEMDILDSKNAYVLGKWELFRQSDTLSGHYSLLWKKMGQSWFIVADHSS